MALQEIYFIAEIIAAFAVVASLIFVGVQLHQSTAATRTATVQAALNSWTDISLTLATSPDLISAMRPGQRGDFAVWQTDDLQVRLRYFMNAGLKIIEGNYLQWLDGKLPDELWHGFYHALIDMFATNNGWTDIWLSLEHTHSAPFRDLVNDVRAQADIRFNELMAAGG